MDFLKRVSQYPRHVISLLSFTIHSIGSLSSILFPFNLQHSHHDGKFWLPCQPLLPGFPLLEPTLEMQSKPNRERSSLMTFHPTLLLPHTDV